jgi:hypothetical protein
MQNLNRQIDSTFITNNKFSTLADTGRSYKPVKNLLSKGTSNAKTSKNEVPTFILYLAPADTLAGFNLCPFASKGCKASCLFSAGRGAFSNVYQGRLNKTKFWGFNRQGFYLQLSEELLKISRKAKSEKVAIRLNGTSDINHLELLERYSGVNFLEIKNLLFYDYTKNANTVKKYLGTNYKLTFSLSENNQEKAAELLALGVNVAAVFKSFLPSSFLGAEVINGDKTDLRYFDPSGVIVGLKAKGKAKKDLSGFVINN